MKKVVEIPVANAVKAFNNADKNGKQLLTDLIGAEILNAKITDRVKTFEDALELVGCSENVKLLLAFNGQEKDMLSHQAHAKLTIISKALNELWEANWTDSNEYKYVPYFTFRPGVGWAYFGYVYWITDSNVGSRLAYRTRELAEYGAKQFQSIYNNFL